MFLPFGISAPDPLFDLKPDAQKKAYRPENGRNEKPISVSLPQKKGGHPD
jgi:hypothetical protein